jgi:adenylate kinase
MNRLRLVILGAPGSGKGTISTRIVKEFKVPHLSSGDLLRAHINQNTEIGQQVKTLVAKGQLVPDDLISRIYLQEVEKWKGSSWLLDGFPRTLAQCRAMENVNVDRVVNLNVPFQEIVNRLKHRWIHPSSGRIYNLEFNPPKVAVRKIILFYFLKEIDLK